MTETWHEGKGHPRWRDRTGRCADLQIPAIAFFARPISREARQDGRGGGS